VKLSHQITCIVAVVLLFEASTLCGWGQSSQAEQIRIVELQGTVQVLPAGTSTWTPGATNQLLSAGDRLRTSANSRVALRWSGESVIPFGASTELEILPVRDGQSGLELFRGVLSFFHRDKPGRIRVVTRGASAGIEGTEFVMAVNGLGRTTLSVIDGTVTFGNEQATLILTNGQQAVAEPGRAPAPTAGFIVNHVLQWAFYYPAVIDPAELAFADAERAALADSLAAYQQGDLLNALARHPTNGAPASNAGRVFHAALLLSVGQVEQAQSLLAAVAPDAVPEQRSAAALRLLINSVRRDSYSGISNPETASELLASSYHAQSGGLRGESLERARRLARQAAVVSPGLGFAWTRLAELEFSFGRLAEAREALTKGLELSPRNAQALALQGFLEAADNRFDEALTSFDRAIAVDSALANAWLGRGLSRIRRGDVTGGREDLMVAAALEPQRAELRSYLGKAHEAIGDFPHAERELQLAAGLDPNDPTPHLYSALVHHRNNRINEAIRELERSQERNDNRSIVRSELLLRQDHAVRSANLARIYEDAGMGEVAMREAYRAVAYDYANYSAHFFLANSFESMRDPNHWDLRFETPASAEYRLASLLAPVDAGPLSPAVSQSEYSRLFNRTGIGLVSSTEYLSRGAWMQSFAQYGTFDTFNYSLEGDYQIDPGQRYNNDQETRALGLSLKQRITAQDDLLFHVRISETDAGDLAEAYDPDVRVRGRSRETHQPTLELGYHHEWSPGNHTLVILTREVDHYSVAFPDRSQLVTAVVDGGITGVHALPAGGTAANSQELYSAEVQQIFQMGDHQTVLGALFQHTDFRLEQLAFDIEGTVFSPGAILADQDVRAEFHRYSLYGYHSWQVAEPLQLTAGLTYDWIKYPRFLFTPPFWGSEDSEDQLSPKAGFLWTPLPGTTVRGAYTRSLTGGSLDQSHRIEPTQVAGLNQAFRSLIPESLSGGTSGGENDTFALSLEQKFKTGTYLGLRGELLYSEVDRWRGSIYVDPFGLEDDVLVLVNGYGLRENIDFRERAVVFTANQLIGTEWSAGLVYRLTQSDLTATRPDTRHLLPGEFSGGFVPHEDAESLMHQLVLHANFNHASGLFSSFEAVWFRQQNSADLSSQPGDDFWHYNVLGGYRFWQRRASIAAGVLNLSDENYHLHSLTVTGNLPRERTFIARLQFSF